MDLEFRHLRAFVAVCEERNFTRAARRLFTAQQALSTQIKQLEERVGARLLERSPRKVELTSAGEALLAQARLLLSAANEAVAAARAAAEGAGQQRLTIGFVAAVTYGGVAAILDALARERPEVQTLIRFGDLLDPTGGLRTSDVDVAFVYGPFDDSGLETMTLYREPRGAALAAAHPLAAKRELSMADFVSQPTFSFPTADAAWRDFWAVNEHRKGQPPRTVAEFRSLDGLVEALRAGLGIHAAVESLVTGVGGDGRVVFRPVTGMSPLEHHLAWRTGDHRPAVAAIVEIARNLFPSAPRTS